MTAPAALTSPALLRELAEAAGAGVWRRRDLLERLETVLPAEPAERVADVLLGHFPRVPWGPPKRVASEIAALPGLDEALAPTPVTVGFPDTPGWGRGGPLWRWPVAPWGSVEHVAHGLDVTVGELDWLADPGGWLRRRPPDGDVARWAGRLRHYRYHWVPAAGGTGRLLEAPKALLAERQRRVLAAVPVHPAAHGFVPGRSVATFAAPHAGRAVVVRVDLAGFFTSITAGRVRGLLATAGYPAPVTRVLGGLLTTATPVDVLGAAPAGTGHQRRRLLAAPHLPQGAPSSPAVANLVAFGLDRRLSAWASSRGLAYTRYADDLAFSGPAETDTVALRRTVARIVDDEGFAVHPTKTRVMQAHRQQRLAGLVVNRAPAVPRAEYDRLRATLHNAAVTGPSAQNHLDHPDFAAHLRGRIAWIAATHPGRGRTLLDLFHRIDWG